MSRKWSWLSLITLLAGGPACGSDTYEEEPAPAAIASSLEEASFAGRFEDDDTFVAVVTGSDAIRAYVCDGEDDVWFDGSALRLPARLISAEGHELYLAEDGLFGSLTRGDE